MAIIKQIELDSGIVVNYHRIVTAVISVNNNITLEVASYINKSKREQEKKQIMNKETRTVFTNTQFFIMDYVPDFSVTDAYNYLKNLEQFKGCEDG